MIGIVRPLLIACCVLFVSAADSAGAGQGQALAVSEIAISSGGKRHNFRVEMALTDEQRARGLMFRRELAPDAGMLFDFEATQPVAFWMKNTFIPLDMLFIAADGRIVNIAERTVPHSLSVVPSAGPVRAVLELNGGTVARLGIRPGDRVVHAIFAGQR